MKMLFPDPRFRSPTAIDSAPRWLPVRLKDSWYLYGEDAIVVLSYTPRLGRRMQVTASHQFAHGAAVCQPVFEIFTSANEPGSPLGKLSSATLARLAHDAWHAEYMAAWNKHVEETARAYALMKEPP